MAYKRISPQTVAEGGTGAITLTDHGVLVGSGTAAVDALAVGGTGTLLVGAAGADPAFATSAVGDFGFTSSTAGATRTLTVSNTNNSNTASQALLQVTTGGASAGDPFHTYTVTGATSFSTGIDNSASDAFKISASTALGTTDTFIMTTAGERTMPLQPAFLAYKSAQTDNQTGDGSVYNIVADTEIYDQGSDYDNTTGIFVAPVTGRYFFAASITATSFTALFTSLQHIFSASNRDFNGVILNPGTVMNGLGNVCTNIAVFVDMDAADICLSKFTVSGSTKTIDIYGQAGTALYTSVSGALIC